MKKYGLLLLLLAFFITGLANNIQLSTISLSGKNTASHFVLVNFTVSWENSWRTSVNESNWDGAWIFIKFKKNSSAVWQHATLHTTDQSAATGSVLSPTSDGKGAFIYRSSDGVGNVNYVGNVLRWNYGADGVADNETVEIKVFALEMVYIPLGQFYLGSGGTETYCFSDGATNNPYLVSSNSAITKGTTAGTLNVNNTWENYTATIPAAYPKGFNAFWIMKYETSQQQYVDFLNLLTATQAASHVPAAPFTNPLAGTHPNYSAPKPEIAMTSINWSDAAAFADWSGLRPLSEMEYEKACRGAAITPTANEYAWGTTSITLLTAVTNAGTATETVSTPANANACCDLAWSTATRTGLFARPSSNRILSGASYYGVLNLGDNVSETVVGVVNTEAMSFDGALHGDGNLAAGGSSDISNWTQSAGGVGPAGVMYGLRGGNFFNAATFGRVSDRSNIGHFWGAEDDRSETIGFRLARTQ